ncbi:MAG: hemolysin III family protein [Bacteroidaceae bacterium]|nr:hemolysin III family protein [Bacteroidaceae bacterium]
MIHYTPQEDRLNAWSHALGILLAMTVGGALLWWCIAACQGWAIAGMALYLAGMAASYITSTVYHAAPAGSRLRQRLRKWDHAAIYWHIAGSYSPVTLVALRTEGLWGWGLFIFVWAAAICGTVASFRHLREHSHLETVCFVLMGMSVLVAFRPLLRCLPPSATAWLIAEGVANVSGAVVYARSPGRPYVHTLFHACVLAGSVCHLLCVWEMLMQYLAST